jgi:uncharacterized protein (DUF3820 family)
MIDPQASPAMLLELVSMKMPFGKYQGRILADIPEPYMVWFNQKGFPPGHLGQLLGLLYQIQLNGLDELLDPLRTSPPAYRNN